MSFECRTDDSPRIRITAHARERMRAEDRDFSEEEVLRAVREGRRFKRGDVVHAVLGRVRAVLAVTEASETVLTVLPYPPLKSGDGGLASGGRAG